MKKKIKTFFYKNFIDAAGTIESRYLRRSEGKQDGNALQLALPSREVSTPQHSAYHISEHHGFHYGYGEPDRVGSRNVPLFG